ncbi:hypothetical protein [Roseomonas elaeocarpi]|uniref:Uncharacterized protein n=1 Tax=Roseomonas elaeocarpi TaxID=907779 RepID=A0ABV6JR62_9PROT
MQCTRSIGLTDLVALMASHRTAAPGQDRPEAAEFDRIAAYLRNTRRGAAPTATEERQRRRRLAIGSAASPG